MSKQNYMLIGIGAGCILLGFGLFYFQVKPGENEPRIQSVLEQCNSLSQDQARRISQWNDLWQQEKQNHIALLNEFSDQHGILLAMNGSSDSLNLPTEGSCGISYLTLSQSIGQTGDPVYEFAKTGTLISQWRIPSEARVAAIRGQTLIVNQRFQPVCTPCAAQANCETSSFSLEIKKSGRFRIFDTVSPSRFARRDCPPLKIAHSAFTICISLRDELSQKERHLAVQAPCT